MPQNPQQLRNSGLTALQGDVIDLDERKEGAWAREDADPWLVQKDDFLVSRGNGSLHRVGRGALVAQQPDPVAFPDTLVRVRPDTSLIDANYLRLVWNGTSVRRQIESSARTTAGIYKVNQRDLREIRLPMMKLDGQAELVRLVTDQTDALQHLEDEVATATRRTGSLRRALLSAAFSGQLTGKSSVLDRIEEAVE